MRSDFKIRTLGRFVLEGPAGVLMTSSKPLAVLLLLRAAPNRELPRERLVELLWSQTPRVRGRQSLRQAVAALRSVLGAEALAGGEESLQLTVEVAADWLDVEAAAASGDYATANRLLQRGEFLPEEDLPAELAFRDEVRSIRTRLHSVSVVDNEGVAAQIGTVVGAGRVAAGGHSLRDSLPLKRISLVALALASLSLLVSAAQRDCKLAMTVEPIAMAADGRFVPHIELEVRDWLRWISAAPVRIRVEALSPGARVVDSPEAQAVNGRVVFSQLVLGQQSSGERMVRLRFSGEGVRSLEVELPTFPQGDPSRHSMSITGVRLHGRSHSVETPLPVEVGRRLDLEFDIEYSSPWAAASVIIAGWSSWLPSDSALSLAPLVTPALRRRATVRASFPPIPAPGQHTVVLAFHAEGSAAHIVSLTNWTVGDPVWHDGNDFSAFSPDQLASLERAGGLTVEYLKRGGFVPGWVAAAALRVEGRVY